MTVDLKLGEFDSLFGVPQAVKNKRLLPLLWSLTDHHRRNCQRYDRLLCALGTPAAGSMEELPWLPVRLFKEHQLRSIDERDVFRTVTSSGTTGAKVSRIDLDAEAAQRQSKALARTLRDSLGSERLPMLILDSKAVARGSSFSARGAGVLGMMNLGRHHVFALDNEMALDVDQVRGFLDRFGGERFLVFGFTFMVWQYLDDLRRLGSVDLHNAVLIHSGGWKQLAEQAVSPQEFRTTLGSSTGLAEIHNFYGMAEQIGTIFLESERSDGSFTCPSFADVIIRDPLTFLPVPNGQVGLIQTVSLLPTSYPGHSVLTEDLGVIQGVDDTTRMGRRFTVQGRLARAEVRGCSDTFGAA